MKLPTLNVDVKVNTSTMKKDIERANKQLQGIGGKAAAFAGGGFGKVGALGSLGGAAGSLAIGAAGLGFAAAAPGMIAEKILSSFNSTMEEARKTLDEFAKTGKSSAMTATQAFELTGGQGKAAEIAPPGFFEGIARGWANAAEEGGGIATAVNDWASNLMKGLGWLGTMIGGVVGGAREGDAAQFADISIASTEQEARQLQDRDTLIRQDRRMAQIAKELREQNQ